MIRKAAKEWLTPDEVAEIVGRDVQTVYQWLRSNLLPSRNVGRPGAKKPRYRVHRTVAEDVAQKIASGLTVGT